MMEFPTLTAYQRYHARIRGMAAVWAIRYHRFADERVAADLARQAVHFARCSGCANCEERWKAHEEEIASIQAVQLEVA